MKVTLEFDKKKEITPLIVSGDEGTIALSSVVKQSVTVEAEELILTFRIPWKQRQTLENLLKVLS